MQILRGAHINKETLNWWKRYRKFKRTTKLIISLKHLPYMERLKQLKLPTLKYWWLRGDMIEVVKLAHNYYDSEREVNLKVVYRIPVTGRAIHSDRLPAVHCGRQMALQVFQLTLVSIQQKEVLLLLNRISNWRLVVRVGPKPHTPLNPLRYPKNTSHSIC